MESTGVCFVWHQGDPRPTPISPPSAITIALEIPLPPMRHRCSALLPPFPIALSVIRTFVQCILPKLQFPVMVHSPGGSRWPTMPAIQRHRHTHGLFDALPDVGPPRDFSQVTPEGVAARQPLPFRYSKVHFMPIGVLAPVRIHNQLMAAAANGTAAGTGKSRLLLCRGMTDRKTDTGSRQAKMKVLNRNGFKECQVNTNVPELFRCGLRVLWHLSGVRCLSSTRGPRRMLLRDGSQLLTDVFRRPLVPSVCWGQGFAQ